MKEFIIYLDGCTWWELLAWVTLAYGIVLAIGSSRKKCASPKRPKVNDTFAG